MAYIQLIANAKVGQAQAQQMQQGEKDGTSDNS
jgi:hypothetical protein